MNYGSVQHTRERAHRMRLHLAALTAVVSVVALAVYGWNYYLLAAAERPFSPKHELLKPSGSIAIKLGIAGVMLFMMIFLYPLRKRIKWLGRIGSARHWLDFHVIAGLTAPVLIAFHASFKFRVSPESRSGSCCRSRSVALSVGTSMRRYRVPGPLRSSRLRNWPKSKMTCRKIFLSRAR